MIGRTRERLIADTSTGRAPVDLARPGGHPSMSATALRGVMGRRASPRDLRTAAWLLGGEPHHLLEDQVPQHPQALPRRPAQGLARTLVLNRPGAAQRRARLLEGVATRPGYDHDEYPPAVGRGPPSRYWFSNS
jgi:hypothetical protein